MNATVQLQPIHMQSSVDKGLRDVTSIAKTAKMSGKLLCAPSKFNCKTRIINMIAQVAGIFSSLALWSIRSASLDVLAVCFSSFFLIFLPFKSSKPLRLTNQKALGVLKCKVSKQKENFPLFSF